MFPAAVSHLFCAAALLAPAAAAAQHQPTAPAPQLPVTQPLATSAPRPLATILHVDALPLLTAARSQGRWLTMRVGCERQLTARTSGAIEAMSMSYHRTQAYGVLLQGRYYVVQPNSKQALCGLYLAPHVGALHFSESSYYNQPGGTQSQVGIGGRVGVQLPINPHWRFDASGGLTGYTAISSSSGDAFEGGLATLPMPELQASFGYVF